LIRQSLQNNQTNPVVKQQEIKLKEDIHNYLYNSGPKPDINNDLVQTIIKNASVNPNTNPTLFNVQNDLQIKLNKDSPNAPITNIQAVNKIINNNYVDPLVNPTLFLQEAQIKQQIRDYQNGNGPLPYIAPTVAQSLVNNVSVNP